MRRQIFWDAFIKGYGNGAPRYLLDQYAFAYMCDYAGDYYSARRARLEWERSHA